MPIGVHHTHPHATAPFEFEAFKPLPCGCVVVVQRTLDPGLSVVSLEAKGTYCAMMDHIIGRSIAVPSSMTSEIASTDLEED